MDFNHWRFHILYRILVPQKVDNLLVAGRCVSGTCVAVGTIRPTVQYMVMGVAELFVRNKVTCRNVDYKELRKVLMENRAVI